MPLDHSSSDRFVVLEGPEMGVTFVYGSSCTERDARVIAAEGQSVQTIKVLARGIIEVRARTWKFLSPSDIESCKVLVKRIVTDDVEVLRYYEDFVVLAPNDMPLGRFADLRLTPQQ